MQRIPSIGISSRQRSGVFPPRITSSATFTMTTGNTAVGTVTATGGRTPYVFSISGGADSALLSIDSSTGAITFGATQHYHTPNDSDNDNIYEITVRVASAGGAYVEQNATVEVTFDPYSLPNLAAFFDPDDDDYYTDAGTTPAGDTDTVYRRVAAFPVNGSKYADQTSSGNRPVLSVVSGHKKLVYTDTKQMKIAAGMLDFASGEERTWGFMLRVTALKTNQGFFSSAVFQGNFLLSVYQDPPTSQIFNFTQPGGGFDATDPNPSTLNQYYLLVCKGLSGAMTLWKDAVQVATHSAPTYPTVDAGWVFNGLDAFGSFLGNQDLSAAFCIRGDLSDDNHKNVKKYLQGRLAQ